MKCELKSGIYKILNKKNNKVYVGRASYLNKRKSEHFRTLRLGTHLNIHLQKSFNKYGERFFEFIVLERCSKELLITREHFWCLKYEATNRDKGYNLASTGESFFVAHSEESKKRISEAHKGKKKSKEAVAKMIKSKTGVKFTKEHKEKISSSLKKPIRCSEGLKFNSIQEASKYYNVYSSVIVNNLKGNTKFSRINNLKIKFEYESRNGNS